MRRHDTMMEFGIRIPRYWRGKPFRYRLEGFRCEECGEFHFSPRLVCRKCGGKRLRRDKLSERGRLISYTVVKSASPSFEAYTPYIVGLIRTEDGTTIVGQLTDCDPEELHEGMEVEATIRRLQTDGESKLIAYGYKFRPAIPRP